MKNQYEIDYQQGYDAANDEWLDRIDKIRVEISKTWYTQPKNRYEEGLKDQALKDMKIIDKYKESEG